MAGSRGGKEQKERRKKKKKVIFAKKKSNCAEQRSPFDTVIGVGINYAKRVPSVVLALPVGPNVISSTGGKATSLSC